MSTYNTLAVQASSNQPQAGPTQKSSHKVQHVAHGTAISPGLGYPDLYIEIAFKSDSKTKLINPANVWTKDVIIMIAPYREGMSEAFNAPTIGVHKEVLGSRLNYRIRYSVKVAGSADVHVGFKDFVSVDKKISSRTGVVIVTGWLDTVTGTGECVCKKIGAPDGKMQVE
ncbi:MAG: hypothetical protein EOO55_01655 [Hymenobacter sp.]|nr:MAG: hypothetical protein EOO55_01655 [Hymenobacter sp.]